jgi:hypothetical protein
MRRATSSPRHLGVLFARWREHGRPTAAAQPLTEDFTDQIFDFRPL